MLIKEEDRNRVLLLLVFTEHQPKVNSPNNLCTNDQLRQQEQKDTEYKYGDGKQCSPYRAVTGKIYRLKQQF